MRVGLLRTQVPFVTGGAERLAADLRSALQRHGHEATEITLPFKWYPGDILADHILAAKLTDVSEVEGVPVDRMIGLKFPAYLARHPDMQFWIIHQHRQAYDQWQAGTSSLLDDPDGAVLRDLIRAEDQAAFTASRYPIHTLSRNVAKRLEDHLGIASTPLYTPPPQADLIEQGPSGDYLFAPGRINPSKRLELVLDALARTGPHLKLVIAGTAENPDYAKRLYQRSVDLDIAGRVQWLGAIDDATMRRKYAEARAVVFVPQDEDYGYVTLEAMLAGKPVITVTDAGGPLEFIEHEIHGLITRPDAKALGQAFERIMQDAQLAERMGQVGLAHYRDMNITWDHVVDSLVGPGTLGAGAQPPTSPKSASVDDPDQSGVTQIENASAPTVSDTPSFGLVSEVFANYALEELPTQLVGVDLSVGGTVPASLHTDWVLLGNADTELAGSIKPVAVEQLRAAIAPSAPEYFPFKSVREVFEKFAFEELPAELGEPDPPISDAIVNYLQTHWKRYLATLEALEDVAPENALDVGVFPPLIFQALLSEVYPGIEMSGLWEGPDPYAQTVRYRADGQAAFSIRLEPTNVERDRWPYLDESFDLVTGMEILEHLALDPHLFLTEANRVLRPGGHLLLTTPNIASHRGVWKMIGGGSPYSFGIFVPSNGVYGRHNREYAPTELAEIGAAAGFETVRLSTYDVYGDDMTPEAAELLASRGDDLTMRGENIVYLARKKRPPKRPPLGLYHGDPSLMAGRFEPGPRDPRTGLLRLGIENRSTGRWHPSGHNAIGLLAEWIDGEGTLRHQRTLQPLTAPLAAGERVEVPLPLDRGEHPREDGQVRLHFYQSGVGVLSGTGRAMPVLLPCSQAAFHNLVQTWPRLERGQ